MLRVQTIQTDYTLGVKIRLETFHISVVRTPLTRNLGYRFPDIKDEIITAFAELIPPTTGIDPLNLESVFLLSLYVEWSTVPAYQKVMNIVCRTSNRLFVGLPLCAF